MKEYPNLDFLRSVAVLLVAGSHVGIFYGVPSRLAGPLAALGVELFFVHTCLVLMQSLERQDREGTGHLFLTFITRRIFRIYPLAILVTVTVLFFHIPSNLIETGHVNALLHPTVSYILYNLTLTQGFFLYAPSIVAPMWTLSHEMEMYLFLPLLYCLVRGRKNVAPILYIGVLAISTAAIYYHPYETRFSFLRLLQFAPCFMPGVLAYGLSMKVAPRLPAYSWCLFLFVLIALSGQVRNTGWFPGWLWWAPITVGIAIPWFKQLTHPILTTTARLIARYSYGVYLTHYFCIWAGLEKLGHGHPVFGPTIFCVLVTVIPVVLYHAIEKPFITLGKRLTKTSSVLRANIGTAERTRRSSRCDLATQ